jgi:CRISPR-associated protein Csd2
MKYDSKKYIDFAFVLEAVNGNLNGDPDNEGAPRMTSDGFGSVCGVSVKRKIRDCAENSHGMVGFTHRGTNLNDTFKMYNLGGSAKDSDAAVVEGVDAGDGKTKKPKKPKKTDDEKNVIIADRKRFLADFWESRVFGATTCNNGAAFRGSVQMTDFKSCHPIEIERISNTGPSRSDGKINSWAKTCFVPYAVYLGVGDYAPLVGVDNGVSDDDLNIFFESLRMAYEGERSKALGESRLISVYVFQHSQKGRFAEIHNIKKLLFPKLNASLVESGEFPKSRDDFEFTSHETIDAFCKARGIEWCMLDSLARD